MKGGRRQGGQRKRLEDNIREWIGLEFAKSQRAVEEKRKWRKLVVKSFVVPSTTLAVMGWVLPQDTTHLLQSPCYQRGSPCQDPAGNRTTGRPDHRKETQTAVVWKCLPFIRSGLILQGTVKGGRRQDRPKKRWEDNIREWTGLEFAQSQSAVGNREKWTKLVAKSSVVPQRPSRLRDR